jgi:hypothetical protein
MHNAMSRTLQQRSAPVWLAGAAVATAVGIILSATATKLPGASPLTVEDAVDADAEVALGGLGVVLIRRGVAAGLGRALLLIAVLAGAMWLCGGLADAITDGGTPPKAAQLLTLASTVLFLPVFVLLFAAPLLLFPTGHLPSPRWRWVVVAVVSGTVAAIVSLLLTPGALDEDVPAWGGQPARRAGPGWADLRTRSRRPGPSPRLCTGVPRGGDRPAGAIPRRPACPDVVVRCRRRAVIGGSGHRHRSFASRGAGFCCRHLRDHARRHGVGAARHTRPQGRYTRDPAGMANTSQRRRRVES